MGTTTSSLFTPLQFTGISQYSSDFQSILTRAVSIAHIPEQALQQKQARITQQESDLGSLNGTVSAVQSALATLGSLGSGQALTASSSDMSVVTAANTGATAPANFSITNVTSLASAASERSTSSYSSSTIPPVSTTGSMQLVVGGTTYPITLTSGTNNLNGVVSAINGSGAPVTASVITTQNGDYLSVSATGAGATTLKLMDDPTGSNTDVLTSANQGTNTVFQLNGIQVSEPNTTVNDLIPGVTLSFAGTTSSNETVHVGLATNRTQISSGLQQLVSSYNAAVAADKAQTGTSPGSLAGNNLVYQIGQALNSIVQYQTGSSSGIGSLASMGIEISDTGQMSLNATTFGALTDSQVASSLQFLGSSTTGLGGLQQSLDAITNSGTGAVAAQQTQWSTTEAKLTSQISTMTTQIQAMEQTLNQQLQRADASVAQLASQQNILNASITSLDYTAYGYNTSSGTTKST